MDLKDITRFKHMVDSAQAILTFAKGKRRSDLDKDRQLLSAVLREFEVLGEAANRISEKTQKLYPTIPWKEIIGMRNRLIHAYFDVDHDVIWNTIRDYLPGFLKQIQQIVQDC